MEANENSGERKIKRFKVRERERGGARRTDPLTEGLEQAITAYAYNRLCKSEEK